MTGGQPNTNVISEIDPNADSERGRTRKKRDFFGTLKRKLGRSKSRAKSMDRGMIPIDAENPSGIGLNGTNGSGGGIGTIGMRSISADRGALTSNTSTGIRKIACILWHPAHRALLFNFRCGGGSTIFSYNQWCSLVIFTFSFFFSFSFCLVNV